MSFKDPKAITVAGAATGATKAGLSPMKAIVAGFLAGAYIGFGGLLAIAVSSGLKPETWGTLPTLFTGAVFAVGLILVVIAGSELLTGNMALVPLAVMRRQASFKALLGNFTWVLLGNLVGALFVAYFMGVQTGVLTAKLPLERLTAIATSKAVTETDWQIFLRAVGCNWLVCLAVWMALGADDVGGKILAIFFPIMAFVAIGFDHVIANMFFIPAAIFAHVDGITWGGALRNWLFAGLGNLVGAGVFVAGGYFYLYGREPDESSASGRLDRASSATSSSSRAETGPASHPGVAEQQPRRQVGRGGQPGLAQRLQRQPEVHEPLGALHLLGVVERLGEALEPLLVDRGEQELRAHRAGLDAAERDVRALRRVLEREPHRGGAGGRGRAHEDRAEEAARAGPQRHRGRGEQDAGVGAEVAADDRVRPTHRAGELGLAEEVGADRRRADGAEGDQRPRAHRHRRARLEDAQHVQEPRRPAQVHDQQRRARHTAPRETSRATRAPL